MSLMALQVAQPARFADGPVRGALGAGAQQENSGNLVQSGQTMSDTPLTGFKKLPIRVRGAKLTLIVSYWRNRGP